MIRQIDERRRHTLPIFHLQQRDELGQYVVCVNDGIVVGVYNLILAAAAELRLPAGWLELLEPQRIALVIGWPVAAHHVQHEKPIPIEIFDPVRQITQERFIKRVSDFVESPRLRFHKELGWHPKTYALAA